MDQTEITIIIHWENQNHKLDLKDKIKNYKNNIKIGKGKNTKLKIKGPNKKSLYIQIRNQGLNLKHIKL